MLIEISSNITFDDLTDDEIQALEFIAHAFKAGNHMLIANLETLEFLAAWENIKEYTRAIYNRLSKKWVQLGILDNLVTCKIVVGKFNGIHAIYDAGGDPIIINVPLEKININFFSPTTLMLEDSNDEATYELITNWYLSVEKSLSNIENTYSYRFQSGGGGRTFINYGRFQNTNDGLILCVVDTDRKYPLDELGATAQKTLAIDDNNFPLSRLIVLDVHERENLIPFSIYKKAHDENSTLDGNLRNSFLALKSIKDHPEALSFFDIKKGIMCKKINDPQNIEFKNYWSSLLNSFFLVTHACRNQECDKVFVFGFPKNIIENEINIFKSAPKAIDVEPQLKQHWIKIGQNIINWCLCYKSFST